MSSKQDKKVRKVLRDKIKIEGKEIVIGLQVLLLKLRFTKRASVAWKILWGKPFLIVAGLDEDKGTESFFRFNTRPQITDR